MMRMLMAAVTLLALAGTAEAGCWSQKGYTYCDGQPIRNCFPVGNIIYCG